MLAVCKIYIVILSTSYWTPCLCYVVEDYRPLGSDKNLEIQRMVTVLKVWHNQQSEESLGHLGSPIKNTRVTKNGGAQCELQKGTPMTYPFFPNWGSKLRFQTEVVYKIRSNSLSPFNNFLCLNVLLYFDYVYSSQKIARV